MSTEDLVPLNRLTVSPAASVLFMHSLRGVSEVTVYEGATLEDVRRVQNALQSLAVVLEKRLRDAGNT
jgi:hypothetical protein